MALEMVVSADGGRALLPKVSSAVPERSSARAVEAIQSGSHFRAGLPDRRLGTAEVRGEVREVGNAIS